MCCITFWFAINTTAYHMGRYSLHLILPKSSMIRPIKALPKSFLPWPVLRPVPGPCVRVELFDDGRLLLDRVGPCAGAGHGGAEEDVDDEHDEEEDAERDAEVEHPRGTWSAVAANAFHVWKWTTLRFRFRVKFQVSGPVDSSAHSILQP